MCAKCTSFGIICEAADYSVFYISVERYREVYCNSVVYTQYFSQTIHNMWKHGSECVRLKNTIQHNNINTYRERYISIDI